MWKRYRSSADIRVTFTRFQHGSKRGVLASVRPTAQPQRELRLELKGSAAVNLKAIGELNRCSGGRANVGSSRHLTTVGRVEGKLRPVYNHMQSAVGDGDAFEELRQWIGFDRSPHGSRIDGKRRAARHGPEVEG